MFSDNSWPKKGDYIVMHVWTACLLGVPENLPVFDDQFSIILIVLNEYHILAKLTGPVCPGWPSI
jgi:hypothetical protein